jgi:hypothetical protein
VNPYAIHDAAAAEANVEHPYTVEYAPDPIAALPPMHQQVTQLRTELHEAQNRIRDLEAAVNSIRGVVARELNIT